MLSIGPCALVLAFPPLLIRPRQVFYELEEERQRVGATDVALLRVEQLCPFPFDLCDRELKRYPSECPLSEKRESSFKC